MIHGRDILYFELEQLTAIYDSMLVSEHPWVQNAIVIENLRL
jgi:hypothetical protein